MLYNACMKCLFIYNPVSGQGQIRNHLYDIMAILSKACDDLEVFVTRKHGDAAKCLTKKPNDYDLIVCSGGDGTLNEVVNGMINNDHQSHIGYIPAGTTNDFASSLGISKDMVEATEQLVKDHTMSFDVGKINDTYFCYIAAFGAFTKVSYDTPQDEKKVFGHLAYVLEGIKSLPDIKSYQIKAVVDDEEVIEGHFVYGMITNTYTVGGVYNFDRSQVSLDDGYLELTLIREITSMEDMGYLIQYLMGMITESPLIIRRKVKKVSITSEKKLAWCIDGEFGGKMSESHIEVHPKAISLCIKKDEK